MTIQSKILGTLKVNDWNATFEMKHHHYTETMQFVEYCIYGNAFNGLYTQDKEKALKHWQDLTEKFMAEIKFSDESEADKWLKANNLS